MPLFETVTDLQGGSEVIRRRRYGVVEASDGRLAAVHFRPLPKWVTLLDVFYLGDRYHRVCPEDRCRLYFNQPRRFSNYLALPYVLSGKSTRLATFYAALAALDQIARIKRSDAILTDVLNFRVSARFMARQGWEPHKPSRWHRHYIKRFYGHYPDRRTGRRNADRAAVAAASCS